MAAKRMGRAVALAALVVGAAACGESTEDQLQAVCDKFVVCSPEIGSCLFDQAIGGCNNADDIVDEAYDCVEKDCQAFTSCVFVALSSCNHSSSDGLPDLPFLPGGGDEYDVMTPESPASP